MVLICFVFSSRYMLLAIFANGSRHMPAIYSGHACRYLPFNTNGTFYIAREFLSVQELWKLRCYVLLYPQSIGWIEFPNQPIRNDIIKTRDWNDTCKPNSEAFIEAFAQVILLNDKALQHSRGFCHTWLPPSAISLASPNHMAVAGLMEVSF